MSNPYIQYLYVCNTHTFLLRCHRGDKKKQKQLTLREIYTNTHIYIHTLTHANIHTYTCKHSYKHLHTRTHTYTYTHTYTHTRPNKLFVVAQPFLKYLFVMYLRVARNVPFCEYKSSIPVIISITVNRDPPK